MSLIASLRTYLLTYSGFADGAPLLIDNLGKKHTQYGVMPLPSARILENYIDGSSLRQFTFAIQSMESIADDTARQEAHEFYEAFADWLETQSEAGTLPDLDDGKTAESIEALQSGFLFEFGESGTGIFQIQCRLTYAQNAP
jgi:hypothetical protein